MPQDQATSSDKQLIEPGEHLVTLVRRHPIGIVGIYLEMGFSIAAVITLVILVAIDYFIHLSSGIKGLVSTAGLVVVTFLVIILLVATYVYRQCRLVVTDKSVVQVIQSALLNRKISRLSMSNVEDVNVSRQGMLQTFFNYGTLTIQTAGEVDNFVFTYCPRPDDYANRILEARQLYVRQYSESARPAPTTPPTPPAAN